MISDIPELSWRYNRDGFVLKLEIIYFGVIKGAKNK